MRLVRVFGGQILIVNAVIIGHGLAAAAIGLAISRKLVTDRLAAYLPPAIYIFFGFRWFGLDGEHRMISPLFIYGAVLVLLPARSTTRVAVAGALCAGASFFTQQRGLLAMAAIGLFLLFEQGVVERAFGTLLRSWAVLTAAFAAVLIILVAPFVQQKPALKGSERHDLFIASYSKDQTTTALYCSSYHREDKGLPER
ncbi:MAG: hypothetical protein IPM25_19050 [Chloracidobacterium sp.]|nr:hypothetical protein [Chloracidobacterium sp.]